jgi:hypothetical protein
MPFKLSKTETAEQYSQGDHVVYIPVNQSPRSSVGIIDEVLTGETRARSASPKLGKFMGMVKKVQNYFKI